MKTTHKKLIGGLTIVVLITTIGVIFASAQTNGTNSDTSQQRVFKGRCGMNEPSPFGFNNTMNTAMPERPFFGRQQMNGSTPFCFNLTEQQQTELNDLITSLKDQGTNSSEIKTAIQEKLDEFGVFDKQLDNAINSTEQRLEILNREKELRNQGYNWEEINKMIQSEFGVKAPIGAKQDMMYGHGFGRGSGRGPRGFFSNDKSERKHPTP